MFDLRSALPARRVRASRVLVSASTPKRTLKLSRGDLCHLVPRAEGFVFIAFDFRNGPCYSPNKGMAKALEPFVAIGQKMWRRTDGAILWLRSNVIVRLELPAAREY